MSELERTDGTDFPPDHFWFSWGESTADTKPASRSWFGRILAVFGLAGER